MASAFHIDVAACLQAGPSDGLKPVAYARLKNGFPASA